MSFSSLFTENYTFTAHSVTLFQEAFPREIFCPSYLSVDENHGISLETYPNPFVESFTIQAENLQSLQIKCFDFLGKELPVKTETNSNSQILLTPPTDFSGLIICHIQTPNGYNQSFSMHKMK